MQKLSQKLPLPYIHSPEIAPLQRPLLRSANCLFFLLHTMLVRFQVGAGTAPSEGTAHLVPSLSGHVSVFYLVSHHPSEVSS